MGHKIWVFGINHMFWSEGAISRGWLQFSRFRAGGVRRVMAGQYHTLSVQFLWRFPRRRPQSRGGWAGNASSDRTVASRSWVPDLTSSDCIMREWLPRDARRVRASQLPMVGHGKSHTIFLSIQISWLWWTWMWRSPNSFQQWLQF